MYLLFDNLPKVSTFVYMERLETLFKACFGAGPEKAELLPLSGSARKYYRMTGERTVIGCIGTNVRENRAFITLARHMRDKGLNVPEVYAVSEDGMAYIQEDLGDCQLFPLLGPAIEAGSYGDAEMEILKKVMRALPELQFRTAEGLDYSICFPDSAFNFRMLNFDLNYFKYDFLKFTGLEFDEILLQDDFDRLIADALSEDSDTFMYRDFQARNIMIRDGEPWFIDFQGGRRGPVQYDLASFTRNAGTHFPKKVRAELENTYIDALRQFTAVDEARFHERYRLISLVRMLQEFGAYGYRGLYERKQIFLDCLSPAQGCLKDLLEERFDRYPYLDSVLHRVTELQF